MKIAIIDYNAGNVQSVIYALNRLDVSPVLTNDIETLQSADKVIFPGVGEASSCMKSLKKAGLDQVIPQLKQPFLGICIGLQLMCSHSEEGDTDCLGVFPLKVKKFNKKNSEGDIFKVPHMGWNTINELNSPLFHDIQEDAYVYYVHSFYAEIDPHLTTAKTTYASEYSAALQKDNFHAVQFHPEKSGQEGSKILEAFLKL